MSSIRLQGISTSEQFDQIIQYIRLSIPAGHVRSAGIATRRPENLEATLTFDSLAEQIKVLGILKAFLIQNHPRIQVDESFLGLTILYTPTGEPSVDIVAVHGLGGHGANTWTCPGTTASMWIRDFIPRRMQSARVWSFGYESGIFARNTGGVEDIATQLLNCLKTETESSQHRPLIFIAHSLGGLVVKEALALSKSRGTYGMVHNRTCCIGFFGTPHRGSAAANWAKVIAHVVAICKTVAVQNLETLKRDSKALLDISQHFVPVLRDGKFKILSFYELQKTRVHPFRSIMVVDKHSAMLNIPSEIAIPLNSGHRDICRFSSEHNPGYQTCVKELEDALLGWATPLNRSEQIMYPPYIPYDPYFVGREELIEEALGYLSDSPGPQMPSCIALVGTPGMGKTSVARRILQTTKTKYDHVFFLFSGSEPKLLQEFREIYRLLDLGHGNVPDNAEIVRGLVIDYLTKTDKLWILVFDNADESNALLKSMPHEGNGAIIATSRNHHIAKMMPKHTKTLHVTRLTQAHGEALFLSRLSQQPMDDEERSLCGKLAFRFNCWPLALRQLSAFIAESRTSAKDTIDMLDGTTDGESHIYGYPDKAQDYEQTLEAAWTAIITELPAESAALLNILSLMDADKIPGELYPQQEVRPTKGFDFVASFFRYRSARAPLLKYDMVSMDDKGAIHEKQDAFNTALSTLHACFPRQLLGNHMHGVWGTCEKFLAHVLAFDTAVKHWEPSLQSPAAYINLMCDCTWYLWEIGQHDEALRRLEWIESVCIKTIGPDTLEVARICVNRGSVFSTLNRYDDAGKLFDQGLRIRRRLLAEDDQLLANSYMQIGNYLTSQGQLEDATQLHQQVIAIRERSSTTPIGIIAISYFNICRTLLMSRKLREAELFLEQAKRLEDKLAEQELAYYENHRLYILGNILASRGKLQAALEAHRKAYKMRLALKSPSFSLAASLHRIGAILNEMGHHDKAVDSLKECVRVLDSVPGIDKAKLSRLARTEMKLAEMGTNPAQEAIMWRDKARQHYLATVHVHVEDWSQVDFDLLVPPIDR